MVSVAWAAGCHTALSGRHASARCKGMLVLEKSHDAGGRQPKFTTPGGAWGRGRGGDRLLSPSLVPCARKGQSRKLVREGGVQRPNGCLDRAPEQRGCPLTGEPPEGKGPGIPRSCRAAGACRHLAARDTGAPGPAARTRSLSDRVRRSPILAHCRPACTRGSCVPASARSPPHL